MSTASPDRQPTRELPQQTSDQPVVTTAPATRRARLWAHVPAHVGRARTSTVVIGCLFVVLLALNAALPRDEGGTTTVTTSDGRVLEIPSSYVPSAPTTPAPATTAPDSTRAPSTSAPAGTSGAPETTADAPDSTTSETTRAPARSSSAASSSSGRSSATSRAPSTTAEPTGTAAPSGSSSAPSS